MKRIRPKKPEPLNACYVLREDKRQKRVDVKKIIKGMACKNISLRCLQCHNACARVQLPLRYGEIPVQPQLITFPTGVGWGYDDADLKLRTRI